MQEDITLEDMIGYYDWEGSPCEIRLGEDGETIEAVIYHPAKGFVSVAPSSVFCKAEPISEDCFKNQVIELARINRVYGSF